MEEPMFCFHIPDMDFSFLDSAKISFVNLMKFLNHHYCIIALHLTKELILKQKK